MGSFVKRMACALGILFLIGFVSARPAFAQLPTPNQPILVVQDSTQTSANPYQYFVPQMLTTEGLNGFQTAQLPQLTASFLSNYKAVVLPHLALTSTEATLFQNFVSAGGTLIGLRPDLQLATTFGVASMGTTLTEEWLAINTSTSIGSGLDPSVMKFHGIADRYSLNGASTVATLYSNATTATSSPAVATRTLGSGQAILFSFDLAQTIVLMRQGNPAWAGYPDNHDGFNTMRPSQMFMDQNTNSYWNDLGNGALNDVPQADEEMRLLSNAIVSASATKLPLPRLWYFPNQERAQLLMTGDDHAFTVSEALSEIGTISSYGGLFSYNVWYPYGTVTNSQLNSWLAAGYSMGVHFNDTAEMDSSGVGGSHATWNGMQSVMSSALSSFKSTYPSAPFPVTTRDHYLVWVSNDANGTVDSIAQAKLFQSFGIQLDTSYSSFPLRWGYMTGSGLPMQFLDPASGSIIPVYEQATQYEDDIQVGTYAYSLQWSAATAQAHYQKSLSDSLTKYNTVITMLNHPENWSGTEITDVSAALQYAQSNSIPISTTGTWLSFWQGRAATTFSNAAFSANTLTFTVNGAPEGLTLLVPNASGTNKVSAFRVDGSYQSYTVATYQGISYASLILGSGSHSILVDYGTASSYSISGTISGSGGNGATVTLSGAANATVTAGSNGAYTFTGVLNGSYTVTPTHPGYSVSPTNASVTINGANATAVNFTATAIPTYTVSGTISGVGGETVTLTQSGTTVATATASGTGTYSFSTLANGTYTVTPTLTGYVFSPNSSSVTVNGANVTGVNFAASVGATETLFTSQTPATTGDTDGSTVNYELGTLIQSDVPGQITGIRFWKDSKETGTHTGHVWSATGTLMATVTFTNESASGWQVQSLSTPVTIAADTTYVVSVNTGNSYYVSTASGLASKITNMDLSSVVGANGVYGTPGAFPAVSYKNTNYFRDVVFVPSGTVQSYSVSGTVSGVGGATVTLSASSTTVASTTASGTGSYSFSGVLNGTYTVTPTLMGYSFSPASASVTVNGANLTGVNFTASAITAESLFTTQIPTTTGDSDGSTVNYELGMLVQSDVAGQITGIRFWKDSKETGTHTGHIWSSSGTLLATATFTGETASGWQLQNLTAPLAIAANTTYVVSVNTAGSYYVATASGLASKISNLDLSSVVGANGVYASPGTFPNGNFENTNYFRDIVFAPAQTYGISGTISGAGGETVTLKVSGTTMASTTANGSGVYSFSNLSNATYTVTPTLAGYVFSPTNTSVTINGANATGINFTATSVPTYTVSGTISGVGGETVTLAPAASPWPPQPRAAQAPTALAASQTGPIRSLQPWRATPSVPPALP